MKSAIFFTLLAFYGFQLVVADVFQDQITGFKTARAGEIQKLINSGTTQQKKKTTYCQDLFTIPVDNTVNKVCFPALAKCASVKCKKNEVGTCKGQIQKISNNVQKCIKEKSYH